MIPDDIITYKITEARDCKKTVSGPRWLRRWVRPFVAAMEWIMWKPVCLSSFVVDAMYRRKIAPHLYMPDNSPLRRLHIRLVKMWMPFFRGRPNAGDLPR